MDNSKRINVFNQQAKLYDKYRQKYPQELIQKIIEKSNLNSKSKILEVGCGTGQLTISFAKRGYSILALDIGKSLVEIAKENLKEYTNVEIINDNFETFEIEENKFDLIISSQAFHWINPEIGLNKSLNLLKKNGIICLIWSIDNSSETDFWKHTLPVYDKYFTKSIEHKSLSEKISIYENELKNINGFVNLEEITYNWKTNFDKKQYIGLLKTYSDNNLLSDEKREMFYKDIGACIDKCNGKITRNYDLKSLIYKKI